MEQIERDLRAAAGDPEAQTEALVGFTQRMDKRYVRLGSRLFRAGLLFAIFAVLGLGVAGYGIKQNAQQGDDIIAARAEGAQRFALTDRSQCVDIERLKDISRRSVRRGVDQIRRSKLDPKDKAAFIEGSAQTLADLAPRVVTIRSPDTRRLVVLKGTRSCVALPSSMAPKLTPQPNLVGG